MYILPNTTKYECKRSGTNMRANHPGSGIRRVDNKANRAHAWTVTIQRRGRIFHKYFYKAAVAYRDRLVQRCRPITRREFAEIKKRNNRSGHVGILSPSSAQHMANRSGPTGLPPGPPSVAFQLNRRSFLSQNMESAGHSRWRSRRDGRLSLRYEGTGESTSKATHRRVASLPSPLNVNTRRAR